MGKEIYNFLVNIIWVCSPIRFDSLFTDIDLLLQYAFFYSSLSVTCHSDVGGHVAQHLQPQALSLTIITLFLNPQVRIYPAFYR